MASEQYPLQRFFGGIQPGERQHDQLAAFEARLRRLELAYGLQFSQRGDATDPDVRTLAVQANHNSPQNVGTLEVTVEITDINQLVLVYYEVQVIPFVGAATNEVGTYVRSGTIGEAGGIVTAIPANVTAYLTPDDGDYSLGEAQEPRGRMQVMTNFTPGTHTFAMTHTYTGGGVAVFSNRYLSIDVL